MSYQTLIVETDQAVTLIRLNRPARRPRPATVR